MIYLIMCGRLGNQLFQYSFARYIQMITGQELSIDFTAIEQVGNPEWRNYLVDYSTSKYFLVGKKDYYPIQRFIYKFARIIKPKSELGGYKFDERFSKLLNKIGIIYFESDYKYHKFIVPKTKNIIIRGWFESEKYFSAISSELRNEFKIIKAISGHNKEIRNQLQKGTGICLTVRRGNFTEEKNKDKFLICTKEYYYGAMNYMLKKYPEGLIYICSDDIEWCKQNLHFEHEVLYEEEADYAEKLYMMSLCKHFVLSNSTFSWWAQFLSDSEEKVVIAPYKWRNCDFSPIDIYSDNWIRMNSNGKVIE